MAFQHVLFICFHYNPDYIALQCVLFFAFAATEFMTSPVRMFYSFASTITQVMTFQHVLFFVSTLIQVMTFQHLFFSSITTRVAQLSDAASISASNGGSAWISFQHVLCTVVIP